MSQLLGIIDEKVPAELTIIAVSLWLIVFLGLTSVVYLLVSVWKEKRFGWPLRGIIWFTVAIAASYAIIALLVEYVEKKKSLEKVTHRVEAVMVTEHEDHEVRIRPTNEDLVKAYEHLRRLLLSGHNIKVIKGRGTIYLTS